MVVAVAVLLAGCVKPTPLPVMGQVAGFQLTAQDGRPFDSKVLAGHIWVADFIYTTCQGPCPMMSATMHRIQNQTDGELSAVRFVSFTVDPAHDTPPVLAEYAKHFQPEPGRWFFLTGDQAKLNDLGLHSFKLNSVDGSMTHSTRFVLMDGKGQIRGYYTTGEDGFMAKLMHDIRQLHAEQT
jgi:protein SCO1